MKEYWKFLVHTKIAFDLRVCHDFEPRSFEFGQVQRHRQKKFIVFICTQLLSNREILKLLYFFAGVYFVSLLTIPLFIEGYFVNEFDAFQVSRLNTRPDFLL